ncbi:MAG TPA: lysylphosphatidylglycerol synthase transmembrane domain-containing protein [Solirubrobacteraceae bacterium]|nr:lysylphosphatidylglycerol synthase transmembrane domain-containing protein [Solirubrobacteraceae bacterium]
MSTTHSDDETLTAAPDAVGLRAALVRRVAGASDALMRHAQPTAAGAEALAVRPSAALPRPSGRQVAVIGGLLALALAVLTFTGGPAAELREAFDRALSADWRWVAAGVGFEALSFLGYVLLFWLVAGRATRAVRLRESAEIALSGAAATRLLPTAGLGGVALTLWALARAGLPARAAVRTLLTFLVLLYTVFMGALAVAGTSLALGVAPGDGPLALMIAPALFGGGVIVAALSVRRSREGALAHAIGDATGLVRRPDARLLGAAMWWGFDLAVLAAMFAALGSPPPVAVLVLAYFTGAVANTIPLPGLVAGGTTGILLAFGVDASLALPAVFAYRAVALWLPAVLGSFALAGLRKTAARWARAHGSVASEAPVEVEAPTRSDGAMGRWERDRPVTRRGHNAPVASCG